LSARLEDLRLALAIAQVPAAPAKAREAPEDPHPAAEALYRRLGAAGSRRDRRLRDILGNGPETAAQRSVGIR